MHFTSDELRYIAAIIQVSADGKDAKTPKVANMLARIRLAIAKADVAALSPKPVKPAKEVK